MFIKTLFFWNVILIPFQLVGVLGAEIVATLFLILVLGSFFIVGLWGFVIILLLISICFLLMRMFEALENKLNDENALKLNFLNEKLKEVTLSDDWRLTVKHETDKYLKEFHEIYPYKIVRIDGEWQISTQS
jgi:predicted membrane protein